MADIWFGSRYTSGALQIRYCNRTPADTRGMNAAILERLNALVKPDDVLYSWGISAWAAEGGPTKLIAAKRTA